MASLPPPAAPYPAPSQAEQDREHLRLLSIFHYVLAAFVALFSLIPVVHLLVGLGLVASVAAAPADALPGIFVGWLFVVIAAVMITLGMGFAACLVVAGIACLFMPVGTALGIFTILVLLRPSVRALFPDPPAGVPPLPTHPV